MSANAESATVGEVGQWGHIEAFDRSTKAGLNC
jgi:hypothetical protein